MVVAVRVRPRPAGRRVGWELHRRTNAPNGAEGVIATTPIEPATAGGLDPPARPDGSAPLFDGAGLEVTYVVRVLVDRRFMTDAAIERPVAIV